MALSGYSVQELRLADIAFECHIHTSTSAQVYCVVSGGDVYFLKVFHRERRTWADPQDREIDPFTCETVAYAQLEKSGLCGKGLVPRIYGVIHDLDPRAASPYLRASEDDEDLPSAIVLEYIPHLVRLDLDSFTPSRGLRFKQAIREIHDEGILHLEIAVRHLLIQKSTDRIVIVDFDRAQTFPPNTMTEKWIRVFAGELRKVDQLVEYPTFDESAGRLQKAWRYCHYGDPPAVPVDESAPVLAHLPTPPAEI